MTTEYFDNTEDARAENAFRHRYRKLSDEEKRVLDEAKDRGADLWDWMDAQPGSREMSIAKTKLEEAIMWAVKGLTK